ncbi:MAG: hypothetical protein ABEJ30_09825 [Halorientalis sp.]
MDTVDRLARRPGVALAAVGVAGGVALGGGEAAALGALVGYFAGKSLRSTARVFDRGG